MKKNIPICLAIIGFLSLSYQNLAQQNQPLVQIDVDKNGHVEFLNHATTQKQTIRKIQQSSDMVSDNPATLASVGDMWIIAMTYNFVDPNIIINTTIGYDLNIILGNISLDYYLSENASITTSDTHIKQEYIAILPCGVGTTQKSAIIDISPYQGTWYVGVLLDKANHFEETNEYNNDWAAPNPLTIYIDLQFCQWEINYTYPNMQLLAGIYNSGTLSSDQISLDVYLSLDNTIQSNDTHIAFSLYPALSPEEQILREFSIDLSGHEGFEWFVGGIIDEDNDIPELNDNNNTTDDPEPLPLLSDLTYVSSHCSYSYSDPDLTLNSRITNCGNVPSGSFPVDYYLSLDDNIRTSDPHLGSTSIPGLDVNGHTDKTKTFNVSAYMGSNWYVGFIINKDDTEPEINGEPNIFYFQDMIVLDTSNPLPDLIISALHVIDSEGPQITYKATVQNTGGAVVDQDFKNHFYLSADPDITASDYYVNDWNVSQSLDAGESKQSWDINSTISGVPPGTYYLGVIADGNHVIAESNENNNTAYAASSRISIDGGSSGSEPDFILEVPVAGIAPVIDGILDPVWTSVCSWPMEKISLNEDVAPADWLDTFSSFKMMYDENNVYVFIEANDDIVNTLNGLAWENDAFELYFDGDNSKNDQVTGYDVNDRQLRYVYNQTSENIGNAPNSTCSFITTDHGYNCEIQIPAQDMTFALVSDHTFGFDIQFDDNDTGIRNHQLKWWSASNDSWHDASLFGTARTTNYVASDPMQILQASGTPVIDGIADETVWKDIPWFSDNTFVTQTDGNPLSPPFDITQVKNWNDCRFNCKMMWQGNMLYLYANVFDDIIDTGHNNSWMNDGFQIFIDGNNDKNVSDPNDGDFSFVYSTTPTSDAAFAVTGSGYTFECQLNLNSELGIGMYQGKLIGFEISLNDNDGGGRDLWTHWWSNDDISWSDPGTLGTIQLAGSTVKVDDPEHQPVVQTCHLAQNIPNPFNPSTTIRYTVPKSCHVTLTIYDLLGKEIATLVNETQSPGEYAVKWNGQNHANAIYLYQIKTGDYIETKKMILQK
ncbi:T9SS type A sorting domain-containing protein [bacterium]|nr:T9SS type A sorting domain-containing protein [bacterium]